MSAITKIVNLKAAKKEREREKYNALVMQAFKSMEHADKRAFLEKKAEVERVGRESL